ncbi:MAG TPA: sodium:proton antiporter NhaD [Chloroflexota bacterium]|nr:sodium:proton antiporter NhaD [Chloroflexota bacterium]
MDHALSLTGHWIGLSALAAFVIAYGAVMAEEQLHLPKSQPVLIAAGLIWILIGAAFVARGDLHGAEQAVRLNLLEYAELFLFLLAAMTYVNTMQERGVFDSLRAWLVSRGLSLRQLFWVTGALAFIISPVADNLTTALVMGAVSIAVGEGRPRFVTLACVNVVVAANAGGAFSPFGDITTLMVWQAGHVTFAEFFALFLPSLLNWLIPATIMSLAMKHGRPRAVQERPVLEAGSLTVVLLFLGTIALTVVLHNFLHLPPAVGMMTGLGLLKVYSYVFNRIARGTNGAVGARGARGPVVNEMDDVFAAGLAAQPQLARSGGAAVAQAVAESAASAESAGKADPRPVKPLDIFRQMESVEWDTLMFFYGVILCVGGLGTLGYLGLVSTLLYTDLGPTAANLLIGVLSAVVDNVPVMFAVLSMRPDLSHGQWLLVTLTAGVGGSMLSVGSAAGVALMGQARGIYTFGAHLKWAWAIALGYAASVGAHLLLNRHLF